MFTFDLVATIDVGGISQGDILYGLSVLDRPEPNELRFESETLAREAALEIMHGLSGEADFNQARDSAEIVVMKL